MIYLDNAATSGKKPQSVINAVNKALNRYCANPGRSGHNLSVEAAVQIYNARKIIADFFGCEDAANVAFTLNCTHAINCVIKGLVGANDRVVISSLEHNAVTRPLHKVGAKLVVANVSLYDDNKTIEEFSKNITEQTRLVICTAASNVCGKKLPIKQIGRLCKQRNIPFAVDAAQMAGVEEINMKEKNIDYLCVAAHKGLFAPMGAGILIARKPLLNTVLEGGTGSNSLSLEHPLELPEAVESGTVNLPNIMGIKAGVEFVKQKGLKNISSYEGRLCKYLYGMLLKNPKIILYSPYNDKDFVPVISFNHISFDSQETAGKLNDRGIAVRAGFHCAPFAHKALGTLHSGTVRISPSIFNTEREIEEFLYILNKI